MRTPQLPTLPIDTALLKPGLRLAVGLSGGADSVALLRALVEQSRELGLVLHVAHLHHGLRGDEADEDLSFCRDLATQFNLPFHSRRVNTTVEASSNRAAGKPAETIEEAARRLRYRWFRELMSSGAIEAVATAHTLDDQAETVLAKFLRGAWTEGLSGIHPVLEFSEGHIIRPMLSATRAQIEAFLRARNQTWREDSTNRHLTFTRNRIRHELLPLLEGWNPKLRDHLAQMAELARAEEATWQAEISRIAPQVILHGRPVRGGGRAASEGPSVDLAKFAAQPLALQRRLLRFAAEQLDAAPDFAETEAMRSLALSGRAGQKLELAQGLRAERTHRELRLTRGPIGASGPHVGEADVRYECVIPGEVIAEAFGLRLRVRFTEDHKSPVERKNTPPTALLRPWKPGDRVTLRHSSGPRKVKEVLERMKVTGSERKDWPVLECAGCILWMRGVELEGKPGIVVESTAL